MNTYQNYLKMFENNVRPVVFSMWSNEGKNIAGLISDKTKTHHTGKCLRPSVLHLLADGHAVEVGTDNRGNWLYAVYPAMDNAINFKKPMCENVFFEQF